MRNATGLPAGPINATNGSNDVPYMVRIITNYLGC